MIKKLSESTILKLVVFLPILATIITSIILSNIYITTEKQAFKAEIKTIEDEHLLKIKTTIKDRINRLIDVIHNKNSMHIEASKKELENYVKMGYDIIKATHEEYAYLDQTVVIKELKHTLRKIRFYDNGSGYFYIFDLKGNSILHPIFQQIEGTNVLKVQDVQGKYVVKDIIEELKHKDSGFDTWYWQKNKQSQPIKKLGFYKKYAPLNLYIGTGKYFDDIFQENIHHTLTMLQSVQYDDANYIFVIDDTGKSIVHPNKDILNIPFKKLLDKEKKIVTEILAQRKLKEGAFLEYKPTTQKDDKKPSYKISFVRYIPELKMTIGTGMYTNELKEKLEEKQNFLKAKLDQTINKIIIISFIVTAILIFIMIIVSSSIKEMLNTYAKALANKNKDLEELNTHLESKVQEEVTKNRRQDDILNQQSKMAAMGEMLGNISHQWRQPLSAISSSASAMKFQDNMDILDKKDLHKGLDTIMRSTQMLSQTIDDFRNFFNPKKELSTFDIKECFDKMLVLVSANLRNKNIELVQTIHSVSIYSHQNELIQALLNIINNAKDAFDDHPNESKKYIFIETHDNGYDFIITIKDNAGGIKESFLNRIFEPYFTTKHQSHGTGIGLYMTKKIIESNLNGLITIQNSHYEYKGSLYQGALCTIRLPKKLKV